MGFAMARDDQTTSHNPHPGVGPREFIALIAAMMSIGALGTDMMLPALPNIGKSLNVGHANSLQWVIAAYSLGFGGAQLLYGPLVDRYGRKPVLRVAFIGFISASIIAAAATSFAALIAARAIQGGFASASRVLVSSIVRDCYDGRRMARVMSLAQMIFFIAPILAPAIGAFLLLFDPWRWNFWTLAILGAIIVTWTGLRLPETLNPADRRQISIASLKEAYRETLTNRYSIGYTVAQALIFGALLGYVYTSEQVIAGTFGAKAAFPYVFGTIAFAMGVTTFINASLVERYGTRKLSHGALLGVIAIAIIHWLAGRAGYETLITFTVFQALQLACFGLIGANFSAMAMQPLGHIAGTASSVQGFVSGFGGAVIGITIGQAYDGTTEAIAMGFVLTGISALGVVLITEGGRLFVARTGPA
jgi:MFS transporter, DHA1 family, multidrug resistance protein